jgi:hypothetical protein
LGNGFLEETGFGMQLLQLSVWLNAGWDLGLLESLVNHGLRQESLAFSLSLNAGNQEFITRHGHVR